MQLIRIQSADDARFAQAMRLYRESFPVHEQRPDAAQRAVMSHAEYHFTLLYDGDLFVGLLLYWKATDGCYVEHFCIEPELRGQSYGQQALDLLKRSGKAILLEIDPPMDERSIRRQSFYLRAGFVANPYPHIHPPYQPDAQGHALVVLSYPEALSMDAYTAFRRYLADTVMSTPIVPLMRRNRQALSSQECEQMLLRGTSGVLAVCADKEPYAVPLSYAYADGKLYFHCAKAGHKLDALRKNPRVSFCVIDQDEVHPEQYTTHYRSVILFGTARVLTDEQEAMSALRLLAERYSPAQGEQGRSQEIARQWERVCMVELSITRMTGKQALELM